MDPELRRRFSQSLLSMQRDKGIWFTPHAIVLLTALIEAIADRSDSREPEISAIREAQLRAIDTIPRASELASKAYQTEQVDGLMLLTVMPRFLTEFCPPFKNPPPY